MKLNQQQLQAVNTTEGPLVIVAGAGSGKTRVLTERTVKILENGAQPHEILAVTFTNKAKREMEERIDARLGTAISKSIWIGTFHSMCVRILRRHGHLLSQHPKLNQNFTIYDASDATSLMKKVIVNDLKLDVKKVTPRDILPHISMMKNEMIDIHTIETNTPSHSYVDWKKVRDVLTKGLPYNHKDVILDAYRFYQKRLWENNGMDFDDLISNTVLLFSQHPQVLKFYQQKLRYISVDEFQDTNHTQYILIKLLASHHRNLCVVGDDGQSVYGWRGADVRNILDFEKNYPDATLVMLEENYRCGPYILQAANEVISRNKQQRKKKLYTSKTDGEKIHYYHAANQNDEARYIANEIQKLERMVNAYSYKNFAILFRTNSQSRPFEEAFMRASIPYQMIGGLKFFQRAEIKDVIAYLQFILNPSDTISFERIISVPKRGLGKTTVERIIEHSMQNSLTVLESLQSLQFKGKALESVHRFVTLIENYQLKTASMPIGDLLSELLVDSGYLSMLKASKDPRAEERIENIAELISIAMEMQTEENASLQEFLEHVSLHSDIDDATDENAVKLLTLHSAKGLEFPVVFICGMEEGIFPHQRSLREGDIEEERRLAYVGITRAEDILYLTHAFSRQQWGKEEKNEPSRFLYEFNKELIHPDFPLVDRN
ncbi:ATP-dependent DNA helicase PcrA [Priestia megaterium]|nr:ATP-dependent DNA helicase PcrA [Priestia megaterium]